MATKAGVLLFAQPIPTDFEQDREEWIDLAPYKQLNVSMVVLAAGSGTSQLVEIQHSAIPDPGAFKTITGFTNDTSSAEPIYMSTDSFLRYIRVVASGTFSTQPVVAIYYVAKE